MQAIGALKYFETSAKTGEGVKEAFQAATKLSLKQKPRFQKCRMM